MTDELHARAVEKARWAAASAIRDWIHEKPFSICASTNMDTCPDWPMAFEIRDVALGAAIPHLEAAEQGDPLVRKSDIINEVVEWVLGDCFLTPLLSTERPEGEGINWYRVLADAIQRRFAPGPNYCSEGCMTGDCRRPEDCVRFAPGPEDGER